MKIQIEQATPDKASHIASLIMEAMNAQCCQNFAGPQHTLVDFHRMMTKLVEMEDSQYSYKNTLVAMSTDGILELFLDFLRNGLRMLHLRDGRNNDVVFLGLLNVVLQAGLVDGQIDLAHGSLLLLLFVNIRI